ncbi:hypothetical protein SADUNF_Sadunf06G0147700 [Salix dunnii]|uniref:Uncharacterized protein n=1 Tax=Salix dunnii TaxID=1413687 RepID=A0A835MXM1_9ROSI|nr:hypothetical protein SADUNF_Sadunf06G0147700 [Salix dunnii]
MSGQLSMLFWMNACLEIYKKNAESILSTHSNIRVMIDENHQKVFSQEIDSLLSQVLKDKAKLNINDS